MSEFTLVLAQTIHDAALRPHAGTLELELRIAVNAAFFYPCFARCTDSSRIIGSSVSYSGTRSLIAEHRDYKMRTDVCEVGTCRLNNVIKTRVIAPLDFKCSAGRLRIDLQTEEQMQIEVEAPTLERNKQRISCRFVGAEAWRVDFTRVEARQNARTHHSLEIEIELLPTQLARGTDAAVARQLAEQATMLVDLLGIQRVTA